MRQVRVHRQPTRLAIPICIGHDTRHDEPALQIEGKRMPAAIFEPREMLKRIRIELDPRERRQADLVITAEDQRHCAARRRDPLKVRHKGTSDALLLRHASDDQRV
jgi:hypothetical protein